MWCIWCLRKSRGSLEEMRAKESKGCLWVFGEGPKGEGLGGIYTPQGLGHVANLDMWHTCAEARGITVRARVS